MFAQIRLGRVTMVIALCATALGCNNKQDSSPQPDDPLLDRPKPISAGDFAKVCETSAAMAGATEYAKTKGQVSPVLVFAAGDQGKDGAKSKYAKKFPHRMDPWRAPAGDLKKTQLVVCSEILKTTTLAPCTFDRTKGDGKLTLSRVDASYAISIREAKTGKVLKSKTVEKKHAARCPSSAYIKAGSNNRRLASADRDIESLVAEFQPDDVPALQTDKTALAEVCMGVPTRSAPAYKEGQGPMLMMQLLPGNLEFREAFWSSANDPRTAWRKQADAQQKAQPKDMANRVAYGAHYSVVSCATIKHTGQKKACPFRGGNSLEVHAADVDVEVRVAKTAKVLGKRSFKAPLGRCPMFWDFSNGSSKTAGMPKSVIKFLTGFAATAP